MVIAILEIDRDENWIDKGNINLIDPGKHWAILHLWENEKHLGTIWMINDTQKKIDSVVASHKDVKKFSNMEEAQLRGLKFSSGTMTDSEVDEFVVKMKTKGIELDKIDAIDKTKKLDEYLKKETLSIGTGNMLCKMCNAVFEYKGVSKCPTCGNKEKLRMNQQPFDIFEWIEGSD